MVHRLIPFLLLWLPGCTAVTAVAALPSTVVEGAIYMIRGEEASFPYDSQTVLALAQVSLRKFDLEVDVMESLDDGFGVFFGGGEMDGYMRLIRETKGLTKVLVKVRKGLIREGSIEEAILQEMREEGRRRPRLRFDYRQYLPLYAAANPRSRRLGWYRRGASVKMKKMGTAGWVAVTMPSGRKGFLRVAGS